MAARFEARGIKSSFVIFKFRSTTVFGLVHSCGCFGFSSWILQVTFDAWKPGDMPQDGHSRSGPSLVSPHPLGKCPGVGGSSHISIKNGPVQSDVETQKRQQLVVPKAIRQCFQEEEAPEFVLGG